MSIVAETISAQRMTLISSNHKVSNSKCASETGTGESYKIRMVTEESVNLDYRLRIYFSGSVALCLLDIQVWERRL